MVTRKQEDRLLHLLATQSSRTGPKQSTSPAVFRETQLDTHAAGDSEDFGPAYVNAPHTARRFGSATIARNTINHARALAVQSAHAARQAQPELEPVVYASVFAPRPEQEHVCRLARERRDKTATSEWAMLDAMEVKLSVAEKHARLHKEVSQQVNQRHALDQQMQLTHTRKQQEEAEKHLERRVAQAEMARYKQDEAQKQQDARAQLHALRQEQEQQLHSTRASKAASKAAQKAEEREEVDRVQQELEMDRQRAGAKAAAARAVMAQARHENDARVQARKQEAAQEKAEDWRLLQQTMADLTQQEKEQQDKRAASLANSTMRAVKAGQQAVAASQERKDREERLVKQFQEQKQAEYEAQDAAAAAKKQAQKDAMQKERARVLAQQAATREQALEEQERARVEAAVTAAAEAAAQDRRMAGIRGRAQGHQDFLKTQMAVRERMDQLDGPGMSERERQLNARLLHQAELLVGPRPTQMTIRM